MRWDPGTYAGFADQRLRPGMDLLAHIPNDRPRRIVDLGCGTGTLTQMLQRRWPEATITGIDSSPEMLDVARGLEGHIHWVEADIDMWEPEEPVDIVFSNAALHWLAAHQALFPRIAGWLAPRGTLAVQMPDNWRMPTHLIPHQILEEPGWPERARNAMLRDRVADPDSYRAWLADDFEQVELWSTTYHHVLRGVDPVLTWVEGSVLRPVLAALPGPQATAFEQRCRTAYSEAYPTQPDGTTILPFTRLFLVAAGKLPAAGR